MSATVDERVVEMRFDNRRFEQNVQQSLGTIDKLKQALNFKGISKGFNEIDSAANNVNMTGLGSAVETIRTKFSALDVMAVTALANITNSAVNAGKRIVNALTIDPIKTGFSEYETKIGAIQTILTNTESKGTTLEDVNKVLNELNTYADQTIYNFAEMTRNIGTFTAAGVDLETSATAIKGIANLAAGSGSTSQQASTAMYQLSQALAAGKVSLQDWNSVVNAGMGGQLFQNALKETAKSMGVVVDESKSFRESISGGDSWLTSDILIKTLEKFANDKTLVNAATEVKTYTQLVDTMKESVQSGWAVSWEHIVGDKEESAKLFTSISEGFNKIIGPSTEARNAMLKFWSENGGREAIIKGITNVIKTLGKVVSTVTGTFKEFFPSLEGKDLVSFSKSFEALTEKFKMGDGVTEDLKNTFKGLFAIVKVAVDVFKALFKLASPLLGVFALIGKTILSFTGALGSFISGIADSVKGVDKVGDKLEVNFKPLEGLAKVFKKVAPIFYEIGDAIGNALGKVRDFIVAGLNKMDMGSIIQMINGGLLAGVLLGIKKFVGSLRESFEGIGFIQNVQEILDGVKESMQAYQNSLNAKTLLTIASAIAILVGSITVLSFIDPKRLASALTGITVLFVELIAAMAGFSYITKGAKLKAIGKVSLAMIALSTSVLILAGAMKKISDLNWKEIGKGLVGVAGLSAIMVASSKALSSGSKGMIRGSIGFIAYAGAISILAGALKKLTELKTENITKALTTMAIMMAESAAFMNLAGGAKKVIATSTAMLILGKAMDIFADVVKDIGSIPTKEIGKGLLGIGGALLVIAGAMHLMPGNMIFTATGMVILASAITSLTSSIGKMGGMSMKEIGKGLATLAGAMIIMGVAMKAMSSCIGGATSMVIMAGALSLLVPVISKLGELKLQTIGKGLLAIAGVFTVLGVAGFALAPVVPTLSILAGVIMALGVGCLAAGAGITLFAGGLAALAVVGTAGVAAITGVVKHIADSIASIAKGIAKGFVSFIQTIAKHAKPILSAVKTILSTVIKAVAEVAPKIVKTIVDIIVKLLQTLANNAKKLVKAGTDLIVNLLKGISKHIGKIVDAAGDVIVAFIKGVKNQTLKLVNAGFDVIISFINGLADAIRKNTDKLVKAVSNLFDAVVTSGIKIISGSISNYLNAGKKIMTALKNGISGMISSVVSTVSKIPGKCISALSGLASKFKTAGKDAVQGFINGIKNKFGSAASWAASLGTKALNALKNKLGINSPSTEFMEAGEWSGEGLILGFKNLSGKVTKTASGLGDKALNALKSPLKNVADIINSDVETNPTIKPVLDLSNVKSGAKTIGGMLSSQTVAVSGNSARSISVSMAGIQNGPGNADVISAIKMLGKNLSNVGGNTYTINGVTYDDGSNIKSAIESIVRAARIERRV